MSRGAPQRGGRRTRWVMSRPSPARSRRSAWRWQRWATGPWLIHKTGVTRGAAAGHIGWARRAAAHPQVAAALAEGDVLTESVARSLCGWTDRLPEDARQAADEILVGAARAGADEEDLARLAAEMIAR